MNGIYIKPTRSFEGNTFHGTWGTKSLRPRVFIIQKRGFLLYYEFLLKHITAAVITLQYGNKMCKFLQDCHNYPHSTHTYLPLSCQ